MTEKQIVRILKKPFTKTELKTMDFVNNMIYYIIDVYRIFIRTDKLSYRSKENGEYGYFISTNLGSLVILMNRLKLYNLLDLGSGPGLIFEALKMGTDNMCFPKGYENESKFVKIGQNLRHNIVKKDILKLTAKDLREIDIIYFWEPLKDDKLCDEFVTNLSKVVSTGQIICYKRSGEIGVYLDKYTNKFKKLSISFNFDIYLVL